MWCLQSSLIHLRKHTTVVRGQIQGFSINGQNTARIHDYTIVAKHPKHLHWAGPPRLSVTNITDNVCSRVIQKQRIAVHETQPQLLTLSCQTQSDCMIRKHASCDKEIRLNIAEIFFSNKEAISIDLLSLFPLTLHSSISFSLNLSQRQAVLKSVTASEAVQRINANRFS